MYATLLTYMGDLRGPDLVYLSEEENKDFCLCCSHKGDSSSAPHRKTSLQKSAHREEVRSRASMYVGQRISQAV